jgi:hypothetical protein
VRNILGHRQPQPLKQPICRAALPELLHVGFSGDAIIEGDGMNRAADPRLSLQHHNRDIAASELVCHDRPGESRADDDDLGRTSRIRCRATARSDTLAHWALL